MGRKGSIPKGDAYLPGISISRLKKLHRKEKKDPKARLRLLVAMARKNGKVMRDICNDYCLSLTCVEQWLKRIMEYGLANRAAVKAALYDIKPPGARCMLTDEQLKELRHDLVLSPARSGFKDAGFWTTKMVMEHVRRRFGKEYSSNGMLDLLHRLGFSSKKPRPRNRKANMKEWDVFKKQQRGWYATTEGRKGTASSAWTNVRLSSNP